MLSVQGHVSQPKVRRRSRSLPNLPQYYYHTNVCEMFRFIEVRYADVCQDMHHDFLSAFWSLPVNAQCLYVRFAGRKGRVFKSGQLNYPEIANIPAALRALETSGFISGVTSDDYADYVTALTKPEVIAKLAGAPINSFKRSWKKDALIEAVFVHVPFQNAIIPPQMIVQRHTNILQYLSFLYFGKIEDNFQPFTLRDLGLVRTPDFKADYEARFEDSVQAEAAYFYALGLYRFKNGTDDETAQLIDSLEAWPEPACEISAAGQDKLLQKLGGLCERLGDMDTALALYARSDAPNCNEREIRVRYKRGDKEWARARLEDLIDNPGSDDAHNFAVDFYARKFNKKRTSEVTDILRSSEVIKLDEAFKASPERAAQKFYQAQGVEAYRTENALWKTLFGLLFWDILFCPDTAKVHSSFERLPADLKTGTFYAANKAAIEDRLLGLSEAGRVHVKILKTVSRHHGTPNGVFRWSGRIIDTLRPFLKAVPSGALVQILRAMCEDYKNMKDGFPDLMLIDDGVRFIEVKAQGDVIRRNQLTRIKQLRAAGFPADIARIDWTVDPNQIYVVVDVETTGGRKPIHRVTEIGAVKMQGGKVIDKFQTLLHPERAIPPNITRLTGISNDMVSGAPIFAEVADEFEAFLEGAIFAAHNVNFDYGFISAEFSRIGRRFKMPKICTCSGMRKHYPGHKSYSLKNLCRDFEIDLKTHHRALCDAEAAAELLVLMNERRAA